MMLATEESTVGPGTDSDAAGPVFIDTVRVRVPCWHDKTVHSGEKFWANADWEVFPDRRTMLSIPGPFCTTISVCSLGESPPHAQLEIVGSLPKFEQGHNLFGSADLRGSLPEIAQDVTSYLGFGLRPEDVGAWEAGEFELRQVDVTAMYSLGSREAVDTTLEILKRAKHSRLQNVAIHPHSVYFGAGSPHCTLKVYAKGQEIQVKGHRIPLEVPHRESLIKWADDTLRFEVTLRNRKLKAMKAKFAYEWTPEMVTAVIKEQIEHLSVNGCQTPEPRGLEKISGKARLLYDYWRHGGNPRLIYSSRETFKKYRKEILQATGLDISADFDGFRGQESKLLEDTITMIKGYRFSELPYFTTQ
jgi:hypothetical protein